MKKLFTHWTIAFVTLFALTWIGLKDPQVKEILRLKSFDLLLQSQEKSWRIFLATKLSTLLKPINRQHNNASCPKEGMADYGTVPKHNKKYEHAFACSTER